jgi:hypothetical protein
MMDWLFGHRLQTAAALGALASVAIAISLTLQKAMEPETTQLASTGLRTSPVTSSSVDVAGLGVPPTEANHTADSNESGKGPLPPYTKRKGRPPEQTQLAQHDSTPHEAIPTDTRSETRIHVASPFLLPVENQSIVLAMRSGSGTSVRESAFVVQVKDKSRLDTAVEFLVSLGFKVFRIDEDAARVTALVPSKLVTPELDAKLESSGLFAPQRSGRSVP